MRNTPEEQQELSDALVTLQLCNYNNPADSMALKSCSMQILFRLNSKPVRDLMRMVQLSPRPLRSLINAIEAHRPGDLLEGTLKLNH